jgi:hypothetical protein
VLVLFLFPDVVDLGSPRFGQANVFFDLIFANGISVVLEFLPPIHFSSQNSLGCRVLTLVIFFTGSRTPFAAGLHFSTAIRCSWHDSLCAL